MIIMFMLGGVEFLFIDVFFLDVLLCNSTLIFLKKKKQYSMVKILLLFSYFDTLTWYIPYLCSSIVLCTNIVLCRGSIVHIGSNEQNRCKTFLTANCTYRKNNF